MSQTETIEMQGLGDQAEIQKKPLPATVRCFSQNSNQRESKSGEGESEIVEEGPGLPSPVGAVEERQQWNHPKINILRTFAAFWGFIVMGMNDAAYGAIIPYLEKYYGLTYTVISLIFLVPFVGYTAAAFLNNAIHMKFGQRGVAIIAPICKMLAYVIVSIHPPYPVLIVMYLFAGFGNGLIDAAWNAWIGPMANSNEVLGLLHGCYGLGATISPLIATTMITKAHLEWYTFYYIMIGFCAIELAFSAYAFFAATGASFRAAHPRTTDKSNNRMHEALFTAPSARVTWLCAFFLLGYVGVEVAVGGWVVSFMLHVRRGSNFASGMTETGFWLGLTVGRVILGFVTPKIGERLAITVYLLLAMGLVLLFWLIPSFLVSAIAVSLQGFFLGPLFPAAIVVATRLLPKHIHVSAVGFAAAFGGTGGAFVPFATGAIAQRAGVKVLQPIVLGMLVICEGLWLALPRMRGKRE